MRKLLLLLAFLASPAWAANNFTISQPDGTFKNLACTEASNICTIQTALSASAAVIGHVITDSGSVAAVTQSGTWNITNVSGVVSLPTGAATAAKQPALGTAGAASADVITVQGVGSMTPILTTPAGAVTAADDSALTLTQKAFAILGVYDGTNADLVRSAINTLNSAGTGIPAVAPQGVCDDTSPPAISENSFGPVRVGCADHSQLVTQMGQYPYGAIAVAISSGAVSNASAVATLPGLSGKTTYIAGWTCYASAATAAGPAAVNITGIIGGATLVGRAYATNTTTFVPAPIPVGETYWPAIPASATNTAIVVTMGATGSGGTGASCNA